MHTTYTYTQEKKKSLKNTKINYTKDLLRHCLLIFWEDFARFFFFCVCAASLSPSKVCRSFSTNLFFLLSLLFCPLWSVGHQSSSWGKKRTVMTLPGDWSPVQWWLQTWFSMKQICFWEKKKGKKKWCPLFVEDKCFICFHTDFFLSSKLMPPQPFFFNTVHHFM